MSLRYISSTQQMAIPFEDVGPRLSRPNLVKSCLALYLFDFFLLFSSILVLCRVLSSQSSQTIFRTNATCWGFYQITKNMESDCHIIQQQVKDKENSGTKHGFGNQLTRKFFNNTLFTKSVVKSWVEFL